MLRVLSSLASFLLSAIAAAQDPAPRPAAGAEKPAPASQPAATAPAEKKPATPDPNDPKTPRDVSQFNLGSHGDDALAIDGYDPVSYFPEGGGKPLEGDQKITADFRGVRYRFASEANRKLFLKEPTKFEPAYGGWCAYGMAKNDKVEIDPESFLIVDGHLMLYFNGLFADTRAKWQDEGGDTLKPKADASWDKFLAKKP